MTATPRPPVEETGHGLKYDVCPRHLCSGYGHRLDVADGEAVYRCEECGEGFTWPVGLSCVQAELDEAAFDRYYARGGVGIADDVWRRIVGEWRR